MDAALRSENWSQHWPAGADSSGSKKTPDCIEVSGKTSLWSLILWKRSGECSLRSNAWIKHRVLFHRQMRLSLVMSDSKAPRRRQQKQNPLEASLFQRAVLLWLCLCFIKKLTQKKSKKRTKETRVKVLIQLHPQTQRKGSTDNPAPSVQWASRSCSGDKHGFHC